MKRLFTLLCIFQSFMTFGLYAQQSKVIERSAKSVPQWLYNHPKGYIVAEVEAPDMSSAKNRAIEELSVRIISSVATNVMHSTSSSGRIENVDGRETDSESFGYETRIAAANIPFVKGISLTEAEDIYWEKRREKKSDRIFYQYAVLYPFPESQLNKMRTEFEALDNEKFQTLKRLKDSIYSVGSTLQIEQAITELGELKEYFFDNVRRNEATSLLENYRQLYKGLTLSATEPHEGRFTVTLLLHGRPFEVTGIPILKSNCATRLTATPLPDGSGYEVTYDDIDCLDDEDNWIEINLKIRDTRLIHKVYI